MQKSLRVRVSDDISANHPLVLTEPLFGRVLDEIGAVPAPRWRPPGFATLLKIILEQQVSTRAAEAMWSRLDSLCPEVAPADILAVSDEALRACGFSRQKIRYGRGLAEAVASGMLNILDLEHLEDECVISTLTQLKGFGRWSAQIYLLAALRRPDVWPADDLALQLGVVQVLGLDGRPLRRNMDQLAEPWRPWRSTAARIIWHHYQHVRRKDITVGGGVG